jgi:hypothetical protein
VRIREEKRGAGLGRNSNTATRELERGTEEESLASLSLFLRHFRRNRDSLVTSSTLSNVCQKVLCGPFGSDATWFY